MQNDEQRATGLREGNAAADILDAEAKKLRAEVATLKRTYNELFDAMVAEQRHTRRLTAERDALRAASQNIVRLMNIHPQGRDMSWHQHFGRAVTELETVLKNNSTPRDETKIPDDLADPEGRISVALADYYGERGADDILGVKAWAGYDRLTAAAETQAAELKRLAEINRDLCRDIGVLNVEGARLEDRAEKAEAERDALRAAGRDIVRLVNIHPQGRDFSWFQQFGAAVGDLEAALNNSTSHNETAV